jgi:restriction system protein
MARRSSSDGLTGFLRRMASWRPVWVVLLMLTGALGLVRFWPTLSADLPAAWTSDGIDRLEGLPSLGIDALHPDARLMPALPWLGLAVAALVALWAARRRWSAGGPSRSAKSGANVWSPSALRRLGSGEFVRVIERAFESRGFHVIERGLSGARGDGAVDIELRKGRETYLVHCRHWRTGKVGVEAVRDVHALVDHCRCKGGFLVTTGRFAADAKRYAHGLPVELVDGAMLVSMMERTGNAPAAALATPAAEPAPTVRRPVEWSPESVLVPMPADLVTELSSLPPSMRSAGTESQGRTVAARVPADKVDSSATLATPSCPLCSAAMVLRTAREGRHAGHGFWGCSRRKECKGIRALA